MPRTFARLQLDIWKDDDFVALEPLHQWMYEFLVSQPDLDHTGVISLRLKRWSKKAAGLTPEAFWPWLRALEQARFVLIDEDTEEVLIRTYMRNDKVWKQPNTFKSAFRQLGSVISVRLRHELAREVRLISELDDIPDGSLEPLGWFVDALSLEFPDAFADGIKDDSSDALVDSFAEPITDPIAEPPARGLGEGEGEVEVEGVNKQTDKTRKTSKLGSDDDPDFVAFWNTYPLRKAKEAARKAWAKARKSTAADVIITGARSYAADPMRKPEYTAHPASWLNGGRWADEPTPVTRSTAIHQFQNRSEEVYDAWNPSN